MLVEAHPDWSPTADRIVFTRYTVEGEDAAPPKIWSVAPDGSDLVQVTQGEAPDFLPAWSRDGTRIAFTRELQGSAEMFVMSADGSDLRQLTHDRAVNDEHPPWSPDDSLAAREAVELLRSRHRVVASVTPSAEEYVRLGPSIANSPEDVDTALRAVRALA